MVRSSEWIDLEEAADADRTICTVKEMPLLYGACDLDFVQIESSCLCATRVLRLLVFPCNFGRVVCR